MARCPIGNLSSNFISQDMSDLPLIQRDTAEKCLKAAREEWLKNVRLGNVHLLRD